MKKRKKAQSHIERLKTEKYKGFSILIEKHTHKERGWLETPQAVTNYVYVWRIKGISLIGQRYTLAEGVALVETKEQVLNIAKEVIDKLD